MNTLKFATIVALAVAVSLILGAMPIQAGSPDASGATTLPYVDNQMHMAPAHGTQWYKFDYAIADDGTRPVVELRLINGTASGAGFEVWTPDQIAQWANTYEDALADPVHNQPVGRGTARPLNCDTAQPDASGDCKTNDLTWAGAFGASGTYLVRVVNPADAPIDVTLTIR